MTSFDDTPLEISGPGQWRDLTMDAPDSLGLELQTLFGRLTEGPLPDRMVQLIDALEEAFRRGELFDAGPGRIL